MITQTCTHCGQKLQIADEFAGIEGKCSRCGSRIMATARSEPDPVAVPVEHNQPSSKARSPWIVCGVLCCACLSIGFWLGMQYKERQIREAAKDAFQDALESLSESIDDAAVTLQSAEDGNNMPLNPPSRSFGGQPVSASPQDPPRIVRKEIGEEVVMSALSFTVLTSGEYGSLVGQSTFFPQQAVAKAGAKFLVVGMEVTNKTTTGLKFSPNASLETDIVFRVVDRSGRQYETWRDSIGILSDYLNMRELAPSITETGNLAYEIPQDAYSRDLVAVDPQTNTVYKVDLD